MAENQLPPQPLLTVTGPLTAGFSQSSLQNILNVSANTVSQLALRVVQYIQGVLADAVNTGQQLAVKVATPIAAGINQAQETINQIGTQVASSITAATNVATGSCASGCDASGGAKYNEYQYNILQDFDVPASIFVENRDYPLNRGNMNLCFRGGWDSFYDAIAFKAKIQGTPPPPGCAKPGGPATNPAGGTQLGPVACSQGAYQVVAFFDSALGIYTRCSIVACTGSTQPPPGFNFISGPGGMSLADAQAEVAALCVIQWYCGCIGDKSVVWSSSDPAPSGVTAQQGPFENQADAQAACANSCTITQPPLCPDGTPPPCKTPPPPPECVCVTLPDCIHIDLCDWQQFEDRLVNALCRFYKECVCKLTNDVRWSIADCDGELATVIDPWKGQCVKIATDNDPDTIIEMGQGQISGTDWTGAGDNPDPWG